MENKDQLIKDINDLDYQIKNLKQAYILCNSVSIYLNKDFDFKTMRLKDYIFANAMCIEPQIEIFKQERLLIKILEKKEQQLFKLKK